MTQSYPDRHRPMLIDRDTQSGFTTTAWGERSRVRVSARDTPGTLALLDYRAPAGFGPPRHVHHQDDEIFLIVSGTIVVWTPDRCSTAKPGDVVLLPRDVPHSWRAYGDAGVHFHILAVPGRFERFFEQIAAQGLTIADSAALAGVAAAAGMTILGPPLSDDEVAEIVRDHDHRW